MSNSRRDLSSNWNTAAAAALRSTRGLVPYSSHNDVRLGRGNHGNNEGNSRFRALVQSRLVEYTFSDCKTDKDAIARQIVDTVEALGGRFLRKGPAPKETRRGLPSPPPTHWEIADRTTVLIKVKQTFRDCTAAAARKAATAPARVLLPPPPPLGLFVHDAVSRQHAQMFDVRDCCRRLPAAAPAVDQPDPIPQFHALPCDRPSNLVAFERLRAAQVQQMSSVYQQQINHHYQQEQQLISLLGKQQAILARQLQCRSPLSSNGVWPPGQFTERALRSPRQPSSNERDGAAFLDGVPPTRNMRLSGTATSVHATQRLPSSALRLAPSLQAWAANLEVFDDMPPPRSEHDALDFHFSPVGLTPTMLQPSLDHREVSQLSARMPLHFEVAGSNPDPSSLCIPIDPIITMRAERFIPQQRVLPPRPQHFCDDVGRMMSSQAFTNG